MPENGAANSQEAQNIALRERVKELTCLYSLAQLCDRQDLSLEQILQGAAELLPPAWQYPEIASARIVFDRRSHLSPGFREGGAAQSAPLVLSGRRRGRIDVVYSESRPRVDEGPFLREERHLIDAVARQLALLLQRRQADEDARRLQDQLRHADRLATIGQLAAGVAHEVNEPLGNILGLAQLARQHRDLPAQTAEDLDKIIAASLHAREIVRKLMLFARQMPLQKARVDLSAVVSEGLSFLASRCAGSEAKLVRNLADGLPAIEADPSQLHQVLVNLVVNAIQAMPGGGTLRITTRQADGQLSLIVEDTGVGMSPETLEQVFVPFFTTKDISEGTGLGLSVVHGIVTAHGGTIQVRSTPGKGSRFEVRLPVEGDNATRALPGTPGSQNAPPGLHDNMEKGCSFPCCHSALVEPEAPRDPE